MLRLIITAIIFIVSIGISRGQSCNNCNSIISGYDTLSYTVNSGQTLCIDSSAIVSGTITLNGGTICNKGFINAKAFNFNSGTINNYSNITLNFSLVIPLNSNLIIDSNAVINLNGGLTNNGTITNTGFINTTDNVQNNGSVTNNNVINCDHLTGAGITNNGLINSN